jgi:hypothetical protein
MCYEFWSYERRQASEEEARKRAQELIEKAKASQPAPQVTEPAAVVQEDETIPA